MESEEFEAYFSLLWLLVLFVSILITILCYLYLAMRKAREKESENAASFSLVLEGQEAERQRIAAELHDTVLPNLKDTESAAKVREILGHIMPPDFNRFNLHDALVTLGNSFVKRTGIQCIVEIAEELKWHELKPEQQLHIYRIVQEAFANIEKHSRATQAMLIARNGGTESKDSLLLSVSDDGVGLRDIAAKSSGIGVNASGFGMRIMRQRSAIIGASIDFISEEGNGCMVCITLPKQEASV